MTQRICAKKHISSHSFVNWLLSKCYFNNVLMLVKKLRSFDKFEILLFLKNFAVGFQTFLPFFPSPYTSQSILYSTVTTLSLSTPAVEPWPQRASRSEGSGGRVHQSWGIPGILRDMRQYQEGIRPCCCCCLCYHCCSCSCRCFSSL